MNLKSIWTTLEDVYDILGGYGFAAMDKPATEMDLKPDWSTWLFAIWLSMDNHPGLSKSNKVN